MTAGMIQDASGKNYWNLDTGQFVTQQGQIADFDIHTDELLGGNYGFNNTGTRIKRGSFSTTYTQAYTVGGQLQIYTHFNSYGSEVSFYITDPTRTTYPLLPTELAGRIVPNYNATLDFRELKLYGGSNEMIALRATSNPYIYVSKRMTVGASNNMLDNTLFGSLQIRKDTGTDGIYLSGKGVAFGKSAITDNLVDSAWKINAGDGIQVGNWNHLNAGNYQYQYKTVSITTTTSWQTVQDATLTAQADGLYAIEAWAAYNSLQPVGIAIMVGGNQTYNDYLSVVDRSAVGLTDGTTQYLHTSGVAWLTSGQVARVRVKYLGASSNQVKLAMWLL